MNKSPKNYSYEKLTRLMSINVCVVHETFYSDVHGSEQTLSE
jgi:hypothetical protein